MTKIKILSLALIFISTMTFAQQKPQTTADKSVALEKPYNPNENAAQKIAELVKKAQKTNKNIMIQAGGNWCVWCLRFNHFWQSHPTLAKIVKDHYLYYHLNWSPENKNEAIFKKYGFPGKKYGYPVFIVLDQNGHLLHVQNSAVLEQGDSYNLQKVIDFFKAWIPKA